MKKKKVFKYAGICFTLLLLMAPDICVGWDDGMEILVSDLAIGDTLRHEWNPDMEYNPVHNEFIVVWRTTGPLRDNCGPGDDDECTMNFQSIDGCRVLPNAELMVDQFQLSPPEAKDKGGVEIVRNIFTNEYMLITSLSTGSSAQKDIYVGRIDSVGNLLYGFERLYESTGYALLPDLVFNTVRREYLVVYNDDDFWNNFGYKNNVGFILDEEGIPTKDPFPVGNQVGTQYAPWAEHNSTDGTYLVAWEDFRHAPGYWALGPDDAYGALLDGEGDMIKEITIMEDCGLPGPKRMQMTPSIAYNPDKNEFLVAWTHSAPEYDHGCIMARIIAADGTLIGEPFLIIEGPENQITPAIYYIKEKKKYFIMYSDLQGWIREPGTIFMPYDIYGMWLDDSGIPITDPVAFAIKEGKQTMPKAVYNPVMDQFLITWRDMYAPDDYPDIPPDPEVPYNPLYVDHESDIRGVIYGTPSFLTCRVVDRRAGDSVGNTKVLVLGPSLSVLKETNEYGWFNIVEDSQPAGKYLVVVLKFGLPMAIRLVDYTGEPLREAIEMTKWW